jgi:hypothetical protein
MRHHAASISGTRLMDLASDLATESETFDRTVADARRIIAALEHGRPIPAAGPATGRSSLP